MGFSQALDDVAPGEGIRHVADVVHLVETARDGLFEGERLRHVARDLQAQSVGFGRDGGERFRGNVAPYLDGVESRRSITADELAPLFRTIRHRAGVGRSLGRGGVDEPGREHPRSGGRLSSESVSKRSQKLGLVSEVAHRRHTRSEIGGKPLHLLEVRVHVPKTGNKREAPRIKLLGIFRNREAVIADGVDAASPDQNGGILPRRSGPHVDDVRSRDGQPPGGRVRRHTLESCAGRGLEERGVLVFMSFGKSNEWSEGRGDERAYQ